MTVKNKKQFGVWMDTHHATILGRENIDNGNFVVLGQVENPATENSSGEKSANNAEKSSLQKYFKSITSLMQNAEEVHITGTGTAQEQLIHFMAETPQFKNTVAKESTANKMSDERLAVYVTEQFN